MDEPLQLVDLYVSADIALHECSDSITFGVAARSDAEIRTRAAVSRSE
jgi:hypothetical protein